MDEVEAGTPASPATPRHAGALLGEAREAHGLSLAEIASRTRIPLRHLEALETGDYTGLPSPTYAVGFAKAYARAAGADEVAVAQAVRTDLDRLGPRAPEYVPYETADPARVPSRGVAIVGLGVALAVLILVGLYYGTGVFRGGGTAPGDVTVASAPDAAAPAPVPAPVATTPAGRQVSLVAKDDVWLRVYDADNKTLYLGTLKPGEKYDVPADANDPMINVGRPDQLSVTLDGAEVPPLGTGERAIKDVKVGAAAIAARLAGASAPDVGATPPAGTAPSTSTGTNTGRSTAATTNTATGTRRSASAPRPAARPSGTPAERLSETQRANLDAAAAPPAATGNASAP